MLRRFSLSALVLFAALACALPAPAAEGEALLALAFACADSAAARFRPFRFREETRTRISDGDDKLEHEERSWREAIQWTPDSTQVIGEGSELVYNRKAKPGEKPEADDDDEDKGDKKERKLDLSFDFFTAERRGEYRFAVRGVEAREGRQLAAVALKPKKKRKELWQGTLWLDPVTGALAALALKPADGSMGLKRLDLTAALADRAGLDVPRWIAMDLEVKLPLIVHKHIRTRTEFSQLAPAP
jgi:hypothetical protein